jgi:outer membrane protein, heavy metal efflux system
MLEWVLAAQLATPATMAAQSGDGQSAPAGLPSTVTLQQVLDLLDTRSPRTVADRATVDVAAADRVTASTLPNPSVSYGGVHLVSGLSTGAVTEHQVIVEQPLLIFKQRQARMDSATLGVQSEQARVAETLAGRRLQVRQAFASLLARQEQLEVVRESVADIERVQAVVRGRTQAGERSRYDLARIETETERFRIEMMNAQTDVEGAARQLGVLLGFPSWSPRAEGILAPEPEVPTTFDALWTVAEERRPSLVALRQREAATRGGILLARRERLPVPAVSGGVQTTRDVNGTSGFFGVSVPVPLFDRGQGPIAKAAAQLSADQLALYAATEEARAEIEQARQVLLRRREALRELELSVVRRLPALRQMAEDAYREGSADILDLLDAMRSQKDIAIAHVQQLEVAKLAEESLVAAAGLDAPPTH